MSASFAASARALARHGSHQRPASLLRISRARTSASAALRFHPSRQLRVVHALAGRPDYPEDSELEKMRQVAIGQLEPSNDIKIQALISLAQQEWGLHGVKFSEVLGMINDAYMELPVEYRSGVGTPDEVVNPPGTNSGSRKVFYLAKVHGLSEVETLRMFCEHYQGVLNDPDGDAHANIRSFMKHGWDGITFSGPALRPRAKGDPQMAEGV